jgi:hypothetical protein
MMLQLPAATAVTTPVAELTVAMAVLSELQAPVPPPKVVPATVYVVVEPMHCGVMPWVTVPALAVAVTV